MSFAKAKERGSNKDPADLFPNRKRVSNPLRPQETSLVSNRFLHDLPAWTCRSEAVPAFVNMLLMLPPDGLADRRLKRASCSNMHLQVRVLEVPGQSFRHRCTGPD